MKRTLVAIAVVAMSHAAFAVQKIADPTFWVYQDGGSRLNHYIPSGWMGDYGDLKFSPNCLVKPASGKSCIQIKYSAERKQGAGWAGIYWQNPAMNWGDKKGGWDLSNFKHLRFKAKGETGKEYIDKFMVGGITGQGEPGDSDSNNTEAIELTKDWKEYDISLDKMDLTDIIGGFGFVLNSDMNEKGAVFYIDEVRFEK